MAEVIRAQNSQESPLARVVSVSIDRRDQLVIAGLAVFLGYYIGAKIGLALTFHPHPVSVLWPPNSILAAALLLMPPRTWWVALLAAFPAHWAAQLQSEVPPGMILCWFISNSLEAIIGASLAQHLAGRTLHLATLRYVSIFCFSVVLAGPFLSSFLDAAFVVWNDWGQGTYWEIWRIRFTSNVLAAATVAPVIIAWITTGAAILRSARWPRYLEAAVLLLGLMGAGLAALLDLRLGTALAFIYLPLPFLLWAAVRFGSCGASAAILIVAFSEIWAAARGLGPFSTGSSEQDALAIQVFLIVMFLPLLFLAASIDERGKAERGLRESEERYREVVESQTDLVCRYLPDTTLTFVNEAYCRFFGRPRSELVGRSILDIVPPDARETFAAHIAEATKQRRTATHERETVLTNGAVAWLQWIDHPIIGDGGRVVELQGIGRDISDRVRAETTLREREARISLATESGNLALWVYDPSRDTAWMSSKGRVIFGFGPNQPITSQAILSSIHPDERQQLAAVFQHDPPPVDVFEMEHRVVNGEKPIWAITRGRYLSDDQGRIELIGVSIDITAQKEASFQLQAHREEMAHLGRVAAMGQIAVSLAHELTQPLTGIVSNADAGKRMLSRRKIDREEFRSLLADISADGHRAGEIIHGIRRMVRKDASVRESTDLNNLIADLVQIIRPEAELRSCELKTLLDPELPPIECDPVEVQQVLVNLVVNAFEAMRDVPQGLRKVEIGTGLHGEELVEITVRDCGGGIPDDIRTRLFEQFFTTKPSGLGMGLAIARTIVESHGGAITADEKAGGGACFRVTLPRRPPHSTDAR